MSFPYIATYVSFFLVIVLYAYKIWKVAKLPFHLRWELYPVPHEKAYKYGGSYLEESEWWTKTQERSSLRRVIYMFKRYFLLDGYFDRSKGYWFSLYPWHIGFYLIVMFHGMAFLGALILATSDISVSGGSSNALGVLVYYATIVIAVGSFTLGSIGSIGLLIQRLANKGLKTFASPQNYFNYVFFLAMFMSGLVAWIGYDPTFVHYREFWEGLITIDYSTVEAATYVHIILFSLFLIYLPFTRSTHYIIILLAYVGVLWNDKPNLRGGEMEKDIAVQLNRTVSWSAPHIQTGKKWSEVATEVVTEGDTV